MEKPVKIRIERKISENTIFHQEYNMDDVSLIAQNGEKITMTELFLGIYGQIKEIHEAVRGGKSDL